MEVMRMGKKKGEAATSAKVTTSGSKANENKPKTTTTVKREPAPERRRVVIKAAAVCAPPAPDRGGSPHEKYEAARKAVKRIGAYTRLGFAIWLKIGDGVAEARTEVLNKIGKNKPEGKRYNKEMGDVLKREGLHTDKLDTKTRGQLLKIIDNRATIESWLEGLDPARRLRLNHPSAILRNWESSSESGRAVKAGQRRARLQALTKELSDAKAQIKEVEEERDQHKREATAGFTDLTRALAALVDVGRTLAVRDIPKDVRPSQLRELAVRINKPAAEVEAARADETVH
jgi:hypothetical protein